jgi:hypothetical protein
VCLPHGVSAGQVVVCTAFPTVSTHSVLFEFGVVDCDLNPAFERPLGAPLQVGEWCYNVHSVPSPAGLLSPAAVAAGLDRRYSRDNGLAYTKAEFIHFYGARHGNAAWSAAAPATPPTAMPRPYQLYTQGVRGKRGKRGMPPEPPASVQTLPSHTTPTRRNHSPSRQVQTLRKSDLPGRGNSVFVPERSPVSASTRQVEKSPVSASSHRGQPPMPSSPKAAVPLSGEARVKSMQADLASMHHEIANLKRAQEKEWNEERAAHLNTKLASSVSLGGQLGVLTNNRKEALNRQESADRAVQRAATIAELKAKRAAQIEAKDNAVKMADFRGAKLAKDALLQIDAQLAQFGTCPVMGLAVASISD